MTLVRDMMEPCVRLERTETGDGVGGYRLAWTEGAAFEAAIIKAASGRVIEGQRAALRERFIVAVDAGVALRFHDVFRRVSDGAVFRVTSCTRDGQAPAAATVRIARAECERWDIE